jgi:hypothetical protein
MQHSQANRLATFGGVSRHPCWSIGTSTHRCHICFPRSSGSPCHLRSVAVLRILWTTTFGNQAFVLVRFPPCSKGLSQRLPLPIAWVLHQVVKEPLAHPAVSVLTRVWSVLPDRLAYFIYYTHIIAQSKVYVKFYTHRGNLKFEIVSRMIWMGRGILGRF